MPSVATLTVGSLHIVNRDLVTMLEAGSMDISNCISQWGIASQKIIGNINS